MVKRKPWWLRAAGSVVACIALVALAVTPAQAAETDPVPAAPLAGAPDDICTFPGVWGGTFLCDSEYWHRLPHGHLQVFVIAPNHVAFTRWDSPTNGLSAWTSLGGQCFFPGQDSIDLAWINGSNAWNFAIQCKSASYDVWRKQRYANGTWSNWYRA